MVYERAPYRVLLASRCTHVSLCLANRLLDSTILKPWPGPAQVHARCAALRCWGQQSIVHRRLTLLGNFELAARLGGWRCSSDPGTSLSGEFLSLLQVILPSLDPHHFTLQRQTVGCTMAYYHCMRFPTSVRHL